jgi:hypothetical protein
MMFQIQTPTFSAFAKVKFNPISSYTAIQVKTNALTKDGSIQFVQLTFAT